jgi:hypothetical protein
MPGANIIVEKILPWTAALSSFAFIALVTLFG